MLQYSLHVFEIHKKKKRKLAIYNKIFDISIFVSVVDVCMYMSVMLFVPGTSIREPIYMYIYINY